MEDDDLMLNFAAPVVAVKKTPSLKTTTKTLSKAPSNPIGDKTTLKTSFPSRTEVSQKNSKVFSSQNNTPNFLSRNIPGNKSGIKDIKKPFPSTGGVVNRENAKSEGKPLKENQSSKDKKREFDPSAPVSRRNQEKTAATRTPIFVNPGIVDHTDEGMNSPAIEAYKGSTDFLAISKLKPFDAFSSLGLDQRLIPKLIAPKVPSTNSSGSLKQGLGLLTPSKVQAAVIPLALKGLSVLAKSETGSGKTLSFVLPIVHSILQKEDRESAASRGHSREADVAALILTPTRELAAQIDSVVQRVTQHLPWLVSCCLTGGEKRKAEKARLRKGVRIVVATPGRLLDHLRTTESFRVAAHTLDYLVLDEADRLLDLGFEKQINDVISCLRVRSLRILRSRVGSTRDEADFVDPVRLQEAEHLILPSVPQTLLLSATLTPAVRKLALSVLFSKAFYVDCSQRAAEKSKEPDDAVDSAEMKVENEKKDEKGNNHEDPQKPTYTSIYALSDDEADVKNSSSDSNGQKKKELVLSAPSQLDQSYLIVPLKWRLATLFGLLYQSGLRAARAARQSFFSSTERKGAEGAAAKPKRPALVEEHCKVILFLSTTASVDFHFALFSTLLQKLLPSVPGAEGASRSAFPLVRLHGNVPQSERTSVIKKFASMSSGCLIATDVAARGLDLPSVDLILQADPPTETEDYVHRVGRTARKGAKGSALLLLQPHEAAYVELLRTAGLNIQEGRQGRALWSGPMASLEPPFSLVRVRQASFQKPKSATETLDAARLATMSAKDAERAVRQVQNESEKDGDKDKGKGKNDEVEVDEKTGASAQLVKLFSIAKERRQRALKRGGGDIQSDDGGAAEMLLVAWSHWFEEFLLWNTLRTVDSTAAASTSEEGKNAEDGVQRDQKPSAGLTCYDLNRTVLDNEGPKTEANDLFAMARNGFLSFTRAYSTHEKATKHIFHPRMLHLGHAAKAFGLREQPQVVGREAALAAVRDGSAAREEAAKQQRRENRVIKDKRFAHLNDQVPFDDDDDESAGSDFESSNAYSKPNSKHGSKERRKYQDNNSDSDADVKKDINEKKKNKRESADTRLLGVGGKRIREQVKSEFHHSASKLSFARDAMVLEKKAKRTKAVLSEFDS